MSAQKKQVLVIDDDEDTRTHLSSRFDRQSMSADFAVNPADALDLIQHITYAVILLNLAMPAMNAPALLERITAIEHNSPVVLVITTVERSTVLQLDANRIHGVLRKPFDPEELVALVRECAEIKSRGAFGAMAVGVMACGPMFALLNHFAR